MTARSFKLASLIVPVYKQKKIRLSIERKLIVLEQICRQLKLRFELIAVVDGKVDRSESVLRHINHPNLKIIDYQHNRGKGFAIRLGMMQAMGDYIGFIDAGEDIQPEVIAKMLTKLVENQKVQIVVGSKKHPGSRLNYPKIRRLLSFGYAVICKICTGIDYQDTQVGAKFFTREVLEAILPRILVKRYAFDVEMLAVASYLGYKKHLDVPVKINHAIDFSQAANLQTVLNMFRDTLAVGFRLRVLNYYHEKNQAKWADSWYDILGRNKLNLTSPSRSYSTRLVA